jgi:hypothetical protein
VEREIRATYARRAVGLRLELENTGTLPLELRIRSDLVGTGVVKTFDRQVCEIEPKAGLLRTRVPAGGDLRLQFERIPHHGRVHLDVTARQAECGRPATASIQASVEELLTPREETLALTGCGSENAAAQLRLTWRGLVPSGGSDPANAEQKDDLRALGYVD